MIGSSRWRGWGGDVVLVVTEPRALPSAEELVRSVIDVSEAACDLRRGDAELHRVNLGQGVPVRVTPRLAGLLRSAMRAARMTGGAVTPVDNRIDTESIPPIHPVPSYLDVRVEGDAVLAPWGASLDIDETARADTADRGAALAADDLECGVLLRIGDTAATAGTRPAGGWQVALPGRDDIELPGGTAIASRRAGEEAAANWRVVTVVAPDAVWADAAAQTALRSEIDAVAWLEQGELAARLVDGQGHVHTTTAWPDTCAA